MEATRYTLAPAAGLKVAHFSLGVMARIALKQARTGSRYTMRGLAVDSRVSVETLRRLIFGVGDFDVETLSAVSSALGVEKWEYLSVLGQQMSERMPEGMRGS